MKPKTLFEAYPQEIVRFHDHMKHGEHEDAIDILLELLDRVFILSQISSQGEREKEKK